MTERADPWWQEKGDALARTLASTVTSIRNGNAHRRHVDRVLSHRVLYENGSDTRAPRPGTEEQLDRLASVLSSQTLTVNVVRSVVDTATALVGARSRPKPSFLTSGGTFSERDRTKRANRLLEAIFRDGKAHEVALRAFRDACVDDCGFVRVHAEDGRVCFERVDPLTVAVSAVEGRNEKPRSLYVVDIVDRATLKARFDVSARSSLARAIDDAPSVSWDTGDPPEWQDEGAGASDVVRVFEAWRLPSGPDEEDGRHVIATETDVLVDEPWTRSRFPIVAFRWASRVSGFWGYSLTEEVAPLQRRISHTVTRMAKALDRVAVPRVFVQKGTTIPTPRLDRTIGQIVEYVGEKPIIDVPPAIGPEWFQHLQWLIQQAYDISGVSRMSATAQKPAGLASGEALREYNDLAADRAMAVSRAWEAFHVELAQAAVDVLAADEAEEAGEREYIATEGRSEAMTLRWRDVAIDRDAYVITAHPTSMLARDFASRKQQVEEMVQAGLIEVDSARRLLELPDLDRELDLANAPRNVVEKTIDAMLRDGVYIAPDPRHDLEYAVRLATQTIALEELNGASPDDIGLELLRQYAEAAREMLARAQQQDAAAQAAQAPAMPAAPMAPDAMPAAQGVGGMVQ